MLRVRYEGSQRIQLVVCYDIGNVKICQISVFWPRNALYVNFFFKCCNFLIFYTFWTVFWPFFGNFLGKNGFWPMHEKYFHVPQDPPPLTGLIFYPPPPPFLDFISNFSNKIKGTLNDFSNKIKGTLKVFLLKADFDWMLIIFWSFDAILAQNHYFRENHDFQKSQ